MKVKWDGVTSLPEPRCITSTSPLCLCANYLDKLVCCDFLGNSAGCFPPSYCQSAHLMLGCFTWSFFAGSGLSRGSVPPVAMGHHPPQQFRECCSWVSFRACSCPSREGGLAGWSWHWRRLCSGSAAGQGRASFWFTLCHSPDEMSGNVTPFLTSGLETH